MIRLIPLAAVPLALCACVPHPDASAAAGGVENMASAIPGVECDAQHVGPLIGKTRSPEVEAEAKRLTGANVVRWLEPNAIVTMEFRADRLNLHLGTNGKIGSARCG